MDSLVKFDDIIEIFYEFHITILRGHKSFLKNHPHTRYDRLEFWFQFNSEAVVFVTLVLTDNCDNFLKKNSLMEI